MNKYSKNFIVGWSIGFAFLVLFNLLLFLAPVLNSLVLDMINSLGTAAILIYLAFWPVLLFGTGLAVYGMILAIIADIVILFVFYSAQKKAQL